jgi:hypothetical protein
MRHLLISTFTLAALVACSSTDQSTGPSLDPVDQANPPSLALGGHSLVTRPLSGRCTTTVTRLAPPPIEVQRMETHVSHFSSRTHPRRCDPDGRRRDG